MNEKQNDDLLIEDETAPEAMPQPDTKSTSGDVPPKPAATKPKGQGKFTHLAWWVKTHKPATIAIVLVTLMLLGGTGYMLFKPKPKTVVKTPAKVEKKAEEPAKPTTVASPLSGLQVTPELAARPVTGMMIENSPEARPQSGLAEAGVVFEATAEGGITRFLALFQDTKPANIGPVRSLRPYYIDWALPFQAAVGHVGGSPQALSEASSTGLRDLDQFANGGSYHRTSDRYAPHNVYTSTDVIDKLEQSKGFTKSEYTPWPRKADKPDVKAVAPTVRKISFDISSSLFHVDYNYDASTNTYLRNLAGTPHKNREDGKQLAPKVVIVLKMAHSLVDSQHYAIATTGSGPAYVYQDGGVTEGTWNKASRSSMFIFKDSAGAEIKLDAGQTWVSIIPSDHQVATSAQ